MIYRAYIMLPQNTCLVRVFSDARTKGVKELYFYKQHLKDTFIGNG